MNNIPIKKYSLPPPFANPLEFNNLGEEITRQFEGLYSNFFVKGEFHLDDIFIKTSKRFFSTFNEENKVTLSDKYFENFTIITNFLLQNKQPRVAYEIWVKILQFVREWEEVNNKKIHKGTPYYFLGCAAISSMDFDSAFLAMHLALEDDKINLSNYRETPAYYFLTLNDQKPAQFLKEFVDSMVGFLRDRLDGQGNEKGKYCDYYQRNRGGSLTYKTLRNKFLDNKDIKEEIKYFFVYSIIRFWHLRKLQKNKLGDNVLAPLIFTQTLGGILITIESLLKLKYPLPYFGSLFVKLAADERWQPSPNPQTIERERDADFSKWVTDCLNQETLLGDFSLSYGLRNFAFHNIESQTRLWEDYTRVLQSVWNCFFKTVEIL